MTPLEHKCGLCGHVFSPAEGCRPSCPLALGCGMICCPRCRYGVPKERGLAGLIRSALVRLGRSR